MRSLTARVMRHLRRQATLRAELAAAWCELRDSYRAEVRLSQEVRLLRLQLEQVTQQRSEAVAVARRLQAEMENMVGEL